MKKQIAKVLRKIVLVPLFAKRRDLNEIKADYYKSQAKYYQKLDKYYSSWWGKLTTSEDELCEVQLNKNYYETMYEKYKKYQRLSIFQKLFNPSSSVIS